MYGKSTLEEVEDCVAADLFSVDTFKLGRIHRYLLIAESLMDDACNRRVPVTAGDATAGLYTCESTDFGREVGRDEIDWWINQKEQDLITFEQRTELALSAAQILTTESKALKRTEPGAYDDLLRDFRRLAERTARELDALLSYVEWLHSRHALAPAILFTYKVWGTTRRSDRTVDARLDDSLPEEEQRRELELLTEIAWGLRDRHSSAIQREYREQRWEAYERAADAEPNAIPADIDFNRVLRIASRRISEEACVYFTFVRDSLRDIVNEIRKRKDREGAMLDDGFWRRFIHTAVSTKVAETDFWDLKETLPLWHANPNARVATKIALAKDLAAFANLAGGCLLIGVSDNREVVGIGNDPSIQENKIKSVYSALEKHFKYPRNIVHVIPVLVPIAHGKSASCLVILVPRACEPVFVEEANGTFACVVRRGPENIVCNPHDIFRSKMHEKNDTFEVLRRFRDFIRDYSGACPTEPS